MAEVIVKNRQITATLKRDADAPNLQAQGISPDLISRHSIKVSGTTALYLTSCDATAI
jgi:hypothetical protein